MSTWIIYLIAVSQTVIFFFITAKPTYRFIYELFLSRNSEWVESNPEFLRSRSAPFYIVWISYILGALLISRIVYALFTDAESTGGQISSILVPIYVHIVLVFGYLGVQYFRIYRRIPLAVVRSVSLQKRELAAFLPLPVVCVAYLLNAAIIAVYLFAVSQSLIPVDVFIPRMIGLGFVLILTSVLLRWALNRKPSKLDIVWPGYRKLDVHSCVGVLYLGALIGMWRILNDLFQIYPFKDIAFIVVVSISMQAFYLYSLKYIRNTQWNVSSS